MSKLYSPTEEPILGFDNKAGGQFRWLSNFWSAKTTVCGITFPSSEAAYQASKTDDIDQREAFALMSPGESKRAGKRLKLREGWNGILKVEMMDLCLRAKFVDYDLQKRLYDTGMRELVEVNHWGDIYWGAVYDQNKELVGENILGKLLMALRYDLNTVELS